MNVQLSMHNRGHNIKCYLSLLINVSTPRNKRAFWCKIFLMPLLDFQQESGFLALLMVKKEKGLLFTSKNGQDAFFTSKKRAGHIFVF